jgi:branched-subunit amino acid transport protein
MSVYTTYVPIFFLVGVATYGIRVIFLIVRPKLLNNPRLQKGLESIPNSLLVAFVIPFTFFMDGVFLPLRIEVLALLITIPIIYTTKRPGLSLIFAISIYLTLSYFVS